MSTDDKHIAIDLFDDAGCTSDLIRVLWYMKLISDNTFWDVGVLVGVGSQDLLQLVVEPAPW